MPISPTNTSKNAISATNINITSISKYGFAIYGQSAYTGGLIPSNVSKNSISATNMNKN